MALEENIDEIYVSKALSEQMKTGKRNIFTRVLIDGMSKIYDLTIGRIGGQDELNDYFFMSDSDIKKEREEFIEHCADLGLHSMREVYAYEFTLIMRLNIVSELCVHTELDKQGFEEIMKKSIEDTAYEFDNFYLPKYNPHEFLDKGFSEIAYNWFCKVIYSHLDAKKDVVLFERARLVSDGNKINIFEIAMELDRWARESVPTGNIALPIDEFD